MCSNCNYNDIIEASGLEATTNRCRVLEVIGNNTSPLTAQDIYTAVHRTHPINRVTVYRILDIFVDKGILDRLSGGRASYYGMAPNEHHAPHPHFYCTVCGQLDCLSPESLRVNSDQLRRNFPGKIDRIEVRIDGICKNCLKNRSK